MDEPMPVEPLLDHDPAAIRETGRALRSLTFRTVPGAGETIRPGWRWIADSLPEGRRVRNFAWIGPSGITSASASSTGRWSRTRTGCSTAQTIG